ncbi:MAG TPA: hypothetical protein VGJ32_01460 [Solirubrobacteraceae bacterium]|jgi:hypothetical protein
MSINRLIVTTAAVAVLAAPAWAGAAGPPSDPGNGHRPAGLPTPPANPSADHPTAASNPGTDHPTADSNPGSDHPTADSNPGTDQRPATSAAAASPEPKGKAYGRLCHGKSKKHKAGEKGTPFSRCVVAAAKRAKNTHSPAG